MKHPMLAEMRTLLPVGGWDIELHDPVVTSDNVGFTILNETEMIRLMEGRPGYWLSMLAPVKDCCLFGVAYDIPSWSSFSIPLAPTVAHEVGHSMGLWHAPCGGAGGPDPLYPHPWGVTGAWGYDRESKRLVTPYAPDLMSYCGGQWISDYHRANALRHRMHTESIAELGTKTRSVLVWGGLDADGNPFLEPSFVTDALPSMPPSGNGFVVRGRTILLRGPGDGSGPCHSAPLGGAGDGYGGRTGSGSHVQPGHAALKVVIPPSTHLPHHAKQGRHHRSRHRDRVNRLANLQLLVF